MVKQATSDRRQTIRAKHILSIKYRLAQTSRKIVDKSWHLSLTDNMSAGGLAFVSEQEFKKDEILQVEVVMSGILDIFKGYGKVVYASKKPTGVYHLIGLRLMEKIDSPAVRLARQGKIGKRSSTRI